MGCKESNETNKKACTFFQTSHIIHMTKSQSVSRIVKRYPPPPTLHLLCFWHNKTAIKYIADPIANQKIQCTSIACEWSIT